MSKALGRGLASLIPDDALALDGASDRAVVRTVPVAEIRPNPEQPREVFHDEALRSLAASLRQHGMLSPIVARRHEGAYILLAGERRLRAAALAGLAEVPVLVREAPTAAEQLELALIENLQREDLDPIEVARGYAKLTADHGLTQDEVALRVGKDRATVANAVRLLRLPEFVLGAVREGRISAGHARAMLPLTHEGDLRRMLVRIVAHGLNVRQVEKLVADAVRTGPSRRAGAAARARALDLAVRTLQDSLRTSVQIKPRQRGGGSIVIEYADAEDFDRLLTRLRA